MHTMPSIVPNPLPKPISLSPRLSSNKKPISTEPSHSTDLLGLGKELKVYLFFFFVVIYLIFKI